MRPGFEIFRIPETRRILLRLILVLLALRIGSHLPLFPELPDLRPMLRESPYLTLLDIFSGGAISRGSAFSLGLYPYFLAGLLLPLFHRHPLTFGELRRWRSRWRIPLTLSLAAVLAWLHPFLLSRIAGVPLSSRGGLVFLTLIAGAALNLWLATLLATDKDELDDGATLLIAFQILAVLPEALASSGPSGLWLRILLTLIAAAVFLLSTMALRQFPLQLGGGRESRKAVLPISLSQSGIAPLLWILAIFASLRALAGVLAGSATDWMRRLAAFELRWTDLGSWEGWIALALIGFPAKLAIAWTTLDSNATARRLGMNGSFIPGFRPGRETAALIDRTFARIGWIEPLVIPWLLAGLAVLALRLHPESPGWPVLLVAVLATVLPIRHVVLYFQSLWAPHRLDSYLKRFWSPST